MDQAVTKLFYTKKFSQYEIFAENDDTMKVVPAKVVNSDDTFYLNIKWPFLHNCFEYLPDLI